MPLLFAYQLNSFFNGLKYSLQRNSLPEATKLGCSDDQWINSYHKMSFFLQFEKFDGKLC